MKLPYGKTNIYARQIKTLARIKKGQKTTHEGIFIKNSIYALKRRDTAEAILNLKCCLDSVNFKVGEVQELKNVIKSISPSIRLRLIIGTDIQHILGQEMLKIALTRVFDLVVEQLCEFLSIYRRKYEQYNYNRSASSILKFIIG